MKKIKLIFSAIIVFCCVYFHGYAQQAGSPKINDIFFQYIENTLKLSPEESAQLRPLIKKYLNERRKIAAGNTDPLELEQKVSALKLSSRKRMTGVIGLEKANSFFDMEQVFRRRVREELKLRKQRRKVD